MGQKHRSWRAFFTWFNMYLILVQCENLYLFLALALFEYFGKITLEHRVSIVTGLIYMILIR